MVGWMNREALERTLETGRTWFWSRSRQEYWCKGETSGDRQYVRDAPLRLRHGRAAVRRRAGGPGRVPHRRAQLLLPRLRRRRRRPARCDAAPERPSARRSTTFVAPGARVHRRAGLARGARRSRDAAVGVREARRRPRRLPARVGRARRTLGPVLVPRPRSGAHVRRARPQPRVDRRRRRPTGIPSDQGTLAALDALLEAVPRAEAGRAPAVSRRHRRLDGLRHGPRDRAPARRPAPTISASPTRCARSRARSPRSTTSASAASSSRTCIPQPGCRRGDAAHATTTPRSRGSTTRSPISAGRCRTCRRCRRPTSSTELPEVRTQPRTTRSGPRRSNAAKEHILDGDIFQVVLVAALRSRRAGRSVRGVPRAAAREPVAVHVLPAPSRRRRSSVRRPSRWCSCSTAA